MNNREIISKKNVMILLYDYSKATGAQIIGLKLANELSKEHNVNVISLYSIYSKESTIKLNDTINRMVVNSKKNNLLLSTPRISLKLRNYITSNEIDSVITISPSMNLIVVLATLGLDTKIIYAEHSNLSNLNADGKMTEFYRRIGSKYFDYAVLLTEGEKDKFISRYETAEEKVKVIPNWSDLEIPNWHSSRGPMKTNRILSVGRLEHVKGFDMLLNIAKTLKDENYEFHWDIYGDGSLKEKLREQIILEGLEKNVYLKGYKEDLGNIYNKYSIFVLTSRSEGLPLVLLEALSSNLALVSFDIESGPRDIIIDGKNGFLVEPFDINGMSKKIASLLTNPLPQDGIKNSSEQVLKKYEKKHVLSMWHRILE